MKNSKTILSALMVLMVSHINAGDFQIDFDGKLNGNSLAPIREAILTSIMTVPTPKIDIERNISMNVKDTYISANRTIRNTIIRCEKERKNSDTIENLKKLLVYGTFEEKISFLNSKNYIFPERFNNLSLKDELVLATKSQIQVCEETNCRTEEVCGWKEYCETVTELTCTVVTGAVGGAIGGGAVGGAAGGLIGNQVCKYVTKNVCKNVKECQDVVKCDTVCHWENISDIETDECVNTPHGTVCQ
ncbi:MAG: hypothetical protein AB1630_10390 [bacterium]